jgi:membrane associated rhomboid family serine protease
MTPAPVGLRCPEHSGKPQGVQKVAAKAQQVATAGGRRPYPVTIALIALNVGVFLAELALGGSSDGTNNWIYNHGALLANGIYNFQGVSLVGVPAGVALPHGLMAAGVQHGEWWRLVTSAFLHFGILHIGLNMLALYWFGPLLEGMLGSLRFGLLYAAAGLAGSAGALWLTPNAISAGASGAIFGILGALLVLEQRRMIHSGGQILAIIVLNLLLGVTMSGISIGAHLGGLIAGAVTMWLYLEFRRSTALCVASAAAVGVVSVVIAYAVI